MGGLISAQSKIAAKIHQNTLAGNLSKKINSLEKEVTRMTDVKGTDDMLSLAIELARNGTDKETIKEKTGLTDDEIDTLYAYHRNLKS